MLVIFANFCEEKVIFKSPSSRNLADGVSIIPVVPRSEALRFERKQDSIQRVIRTFV